MYFIVKMTYNFACWIKGRKAYR